MNAPVHQSVMELTDRASGPVPPCPMPLSLLAPWLAVSQPFGLSAIGFESSSAGDALFGELGGVYQ